jgi:hypothetical protein
MLAIHDGLDVSSNAKKMHVTGNLHRGILNLTGGGQHHPVLQQNSLRARLSGDYSMAGTQSSVLWNTS